MSKAWAFTKKGAYYGMIGGAAVGAVVGLLAGGPFGLVFGAIGGAIRWAIVGSIGGAAIGAFQKDDAPAVIAPSTPSEKLGRSVNTPQLEQDITPEVGNTKFQSMVDQSRAQQAAGVTH